MTGNTTVHARITIEEMKLSRVPFFISVIKNVSEKYANDIYVHRKNPLNTEYTGSKRKSGFLHFSIVTISHNKNITPNKHIVKLKANPN